MTGLLSALLVPFLAAAAAAASPPRADLGQLAWMAGSWGGKSENLLMEEHWTAPAGGVMLGMHRDVPGAGPAFFEFLRIEAGPDGIVYLAQPKGAAPTPFPLSELGDRRVVFENPAHDFPTRILYWLGDDGALNARVEGSRGGAVAAESWRWQPLPPR